MKIAIRSHDSKLLQTPLSIKDVEKLKLGDVVYLSGEIVTARDKAHGRIIESGRAPASLNLVYHCGPHVKKNKSWRILSAGPTTSARMNRYTKLLLEKFGTRAIIGKGGMGSESLEAFSKHRCVYLAFTGGCGVLAAQRIKEVKEVHWLDLGVPEALWVLRVENFGPLVVAMDCRGGTMYKS